MKTRPFVSIFLMLTALASARLWAAPQNPAPETAEAAPVAAEAPKPPAAEAPSAPAVPESAEPAPLRDLTAEPAATTSATPAQPSAPPAVEEERSTPHRSGHARREVVSIGGAHLGRGESAHAVVGVLGDAWAEGPVDDAVVAVLGSSTAEESVGAAVVAVMGNATARKSVGQNVVAVMGDAFVEGTVGGEVVAVMGTVYLGPKAVVNGNVVSVGGRVRRDAGAVVNGHVNEVSFFDQLPFLASVGAWLQETILKGRFLAFDWRFLWTWFAAFAFLGLYLLVALVCNGPVNRCVDTLEQRPGRTILAALLSMIATPALLILLTFTVIGPVLFLLVLLVAMIFAKAAFLAFIGRRISKPLGLSHAVGAVFFGGLVVMLLYTIPVLGFLVWKVGAALGLGMVVYTVILAAQRDKGARPNGGGPGGYGSPALVGTPGTPPTAGPGANPFAAPAPSTGTPSGALPTGGAPEANMTVPPFTSVAVSPVAPPPPPPVVSFSALPRAGFWIRLAASVLDAVLVGALSGMLHVGEYFLFLFTAYCVVMWATKGTTVGGVVCGLKLVRLDDRRIDWSVALVRSLAAFLSIAIAGLGFIWVAFDNERQSWHDKIAGTTIVHVPRGVPLV